jgi:hypothetical protein
VPGAIVGFDFTAILSLGRATGVNITALAEWLPGIEAKAVNAMNKISLGCNLDLGNIYATMATANPSNAYLINRVKASHKSSE